MSCITLYKKLKRLTHIRVTCKISSMNDKTNKISYPWQKQNNH